jgi:hypothetical protein
MDYRLDNQISVPSRGKDFSPLYSVLLWGLLSHHFKDTGVSSPGNETEALSQPLISM